MDNGFDSCWHISHTGKTSKFIDELCPSHGPAGFLDSRAGSKYGVAHNSVYTIVYIAYIQLCWPCVAKLIFAKEREYDEKTRSGEYTIIGHPVIKYRNMELHRQ